MKTSFNKQKTIQTAVGFFLIFLLILLDQITKYLAAMHLKNAPAFELIPGVFELYYLENQGAAFSILWGQKNFFIVLTTILLIIMFYLYIHMPKDKRFFIARAIFVLVIAGAIGNFIDRCIHNYVIDFFYFKLINFAVFNVADIYITVGAALFIFAFCFYYKEEEINKIFPFLEKKKEK